MNAPRKIWWTASEIASAGLPELPGSQQGVDKLAKAQDWRGHADFSRRRSGRGGGWEYNWQLFPLPARKKLLADAKQVAIPARPVPQARDDQWDWFDAQKDGVKAKAKARLEVIEAVEALETLGTPRYLAVIEVSKVTAPGRATIWNWLAMIEQVAVADRLAYLAPRHNGAKRATKKQAVDPRFFEVLKADYLRLEQPSFTSSYRRACEIAQTQGWSVCLEDTMRRRMNELVPRVTQIFARKGVAGLEQCFPPQTRDRSSMVAMEGVNADCHKIDVFVTWKDGTVNRPQIIAFQDIYSGKILSWRVDWAPNKVAVMAAFGDMIEDYGIPHRCLFDNGREFANKWLTGGVKTRFRFKVREDDPLGVLPQLGIKVHWARPGHGQAKPIERAFRDLADDIAKDPRFAGAYVGNRPDAKPENYGDRAVELADFLKVVEEGIKRHNARTGRRSHTCQGRSFDVTFASSYKTAPIRKATGAQRRLWLMGQEEKRLQRGHGRLALYENEYWSDWMNAHAGEKIVARFDPEDLHDGVHIYALSGEYLGAAECQAKTGFFDLASARQSAADLAANKRAHRKLLKDLRPQTARDVAAHLDDIQPKDADPLEGKVIRPAFGTRPGGPAGAPATPQSGFEDTWAPVAEFKAPEPVHEVETAEVEDRYTRFRRALELETALAEKLWVGEAEKLWLGQYQTQPEYSSMRKMYDGFGEAMFAE